jgi:hypothetical protein
LVVAALDFRREPANRSVSVGAFETFERFSAVACFGASVAGSTVVIFTFEA